jgi:hypothetical protein
LKFAIGNLHLSKTSENGSGSNFLEENQNIRPFYNIFARKTAFEMAHRLTNNVFGPNGVFVHTSCENCGAIAGTVQAGQPCPNPMIQAGNSIFPFHSQ